MKKLIIMIFLGLFTQCQSQKKYNNMIPTVDTKFEKFNIEEFKKLLKPNNSSVLNNINNEITEILETQSNGYIRRRYNKLYFFKENTFFYANGNIQKKGLLFNNGYPIGIWYHFDESGKLVKEEDTDADYGFKPADVLQFCKKNTIELPRGYQSSGFQNSVMKTELDGKKVWEIKYKLPISEQKKGPQQIGIIVLDGKDGKELSKKIGLLEGP